MGHVDARVRDSRVINEKIRRRCLSDKDFIRQKNKRRENLKVEYFHPLFLQRNIENRNLFNAIKAK